MADPTIPRIVKLGPGRYDAICGDERLLIRRAVSGLWTIKRRGGGNLGIIFPSLSGAKEYAHDWLGEYA